MDQKKYNKILKTLTDYKEDLTKKGYHVIGIFLYGSQNYQMDNEKSDIDAVAVIMPNKYEFALKSPVSGKEKMANGEVKVKDIRTYAAELLKANYSTLETLLTPYKVTEPGYFEFDDLVSEVLFYDRQHTLKGALGTVNQMLKEANHTKNKPEKRQKAIARIKHLQGFISMLMHSVHTKEDYCLALCGVRNWEKDEPDAYARDLKRTKYQEFSTENDRQKWLMLETAKVEKQDARLMKEVKLFCLHEQKNEPDKKKTEEHVAAWVVNCFRKFDEEMRG